MTMPVENFKEIVRCSQLGVPLENDLMEWLGECLSEVLARRVSSFEEAFGLQNGRGGVPWWLASAMQERNKALRALARYHFADLPRSQQARGIEALSSRYMASAWRFDRNRGVSLALRQESAGDAVAVQAPAAGMALACLQVRRIYAVISASIAQHPMSEARSLEFDAPS
jgi:hypothetical protein